MGHHVKQHLGYGPAKQEQARLEEIENAEKEKLIAEQDAQTQALLGGAAAVGLGEAGRAVGGTGGQVLGIVGGLIGGASQQSAQNIDQIKAEIEQKAAIRYQERLREISHNQEFEADELGYLYSVTAGFDSSGCKDVMEVLGRMPGSQLDSESHPAPKKRIDSLEALMVENPPQTLKAKGENLLKAKLNPLKYEVFSYQVEDGGTYSGLKIYPLTGTTQDDLNRFLTQ
jgi:predicted Zn-dependent protease